MKYFPIFADLDSADVLVAGGGEQAAQKVRLLRKTERAHHRGGRADADELRALARRRRHRHCRRARSSPAMSTGKRLVYAATGDRALDAAVSAAAQARGIPVNVVDAPELSTFITPAIVDRDPGDGGDRHGRRRAGAGARDQDASSRRCCRPTSAALAARAQACATVVAATVADGRARRRLWERLLQGPFRRAVLSGADDEAERILAAELDGRRRSQRSGRVALIGCGPGDPDLLTLKALQRMQEADVLVVDRLVNPKILDYARRDAERIYRRQDAGRRRPRRRPRSTASWCARPPPARWWPASRAATPSSSAARPRRWRRCRRPASRSRWCRA